MSQTTIERVRAYVDENGGNRLLAGLAALFVIFVFYLAGLVGERLSERSIEVAALKAEVQGLQSLASDQEMAERLNAYRQALSTYESRVIEAETAGLISAEIQSMIRASAQSAELNKVQVEVNINDELSTEELIVFRVDVRGVEKIDGSFARFIADVISGKTAFYVLSVNWDRRSGLVRIEFECVGRIKEPAS